MRYQRSECPSAPSTTYVYLVVSVSKREVIGVFSNPESANRAGEFCGVTYVVKELKLDSVESNDGSTSL